MALLRARRLRGWVRDTALDWDAGRWRVEVRYEGGRRVWWWEPTIDDAAARRRAGDRRRRPGWWLRG